jgi:transposase
VTGRARKVAAAVTIPGIGPVLAAAFLAKIADVTRFAGPAQLTSWAGLMPTHRESDLQVHRGRITKQDRGRITMRGSRLVRWAIEAVQRVGSHTRIGAVRRWVAARRGRTIGVIAAAGNCSSWSSSLRCATDTSAAY